MEEEEEEISPEQEIDFCTMGMFIIGKKIVPVSNFHACIFNYLPVFHRH